MIVVVQKNHLKNEGNGFRENVMSKKIHAQISVQNLTLNLHVASYGINAI